MKRLLFIVALLLGGSLTEQAEGAHASPCGLLATETCSSAKRRRV
ncbi:hypothetical protein [Paraburkholderia phosphatilytica]|nr:hypothetical protein [Paraburkholderia phosphatilytica]